MMPKASPRVPKGYPSDTIFGCSRAPGGNVKTMVSCRRIHHFHDWRGSWDTPCAALCAQCVNVLLGTTFPRFSVVLGSKGGSRGRTHKGATNHFSSYFLCPASFGGPWGAQGRQTHPKSTKIIPECTPRVPKRRPKYS